MQLRKLELFGFKSFPDKVSIEISDGIMGVVGPNGCGKSNIVDAIRWALGEQSARILRGEKMDDVIFAGSKSRKPLGMAQVTLTFSNEDGRLPVEYSEVSVTRRVYRSGESEYLLNKQPCRLRDIREMFRGTGVGSHSYSLIERSQIDSVISDGTGDRRLLLEEAAGITNYKARKKEALRKLEATESDLLRLNDIIAEVEREARSLGRQVGKAKRYERYSVKVRELDVTVSWRKYKDLLEEQRTLKGILSEQRAQEAGLQARRGALEADVETLKADLLDKGRLVSEIEQNLRQAEAELAEVRERISVLSERRRGLLERAEAAEQEARETAARAERERRRSSELTPERERAKQRVEEARERAARAGRDAADAERALAAARKELDSIKRPAIESIERAAQLQAGLERQRSELAERSRQIERDRERKQELESRKEALEKKLQTARAELEEIVDALKEYRVEEERRVARTTELWERGSALRDREKELAERCAALQSRLKLLEELQRSYEGLDEGVVLVMKDEHLRTKARIVGPLAGLLSVPKKLVPAVEAALGEALRHLVSENVEEAVRALCGNGSGPPAGVTVLDARREAPAADARADILSRPGVVGWLPDLCGGEKLDPVAARFLSRAYVVENEETALGLAKALRDKEVVFVTEEGFAVGAGASMLRTAGATQAAGIICRAGEIESCASQLRTVETELAAVRTEKAELETDRSKALESLEEMRQRVESLQQACFDRDREVSTLGAQLEACVEELEHVQERITAACSASERAKQETHRAGSMLRDAEAERERFEGQLKTAEEKERELEEELARRQEACHAAQTVLGEAERRVSELEAEMERLASAAEELERRSSDKREAARAARAQCVALAEEQRTLEGSLDRRDEARRELETRLKGARQQFTLVEAALSEKEVQAKEARSAAQGATSKAHETELKLAQIAAEAGALKERVSSEHGVDLDRFTPTLEEGVAAEEMERELRDLKEKLGKLGAVNLLAVEEYKKTRERLQFLSEQRNDLVQARESLLQAIEKINATASALFMQTFTRVRANFRKTFAALFKDGEAELLLNGDDPLEAEVEIQARPGGKKLQSIKLLSGGEKALTAIALLFAVYLVKPSPFCILDEVDAPLDDANVDRFVSMLRQFSARTQFIVVTHNKTTMEAADRLYGITMPEPGVSRLVSVRFDEAGKLAEQAAETAAVGA